MAWAGKEIRAELEAKPEALCEYEQLLKQAIFNNRAEGYSTRGKAARERFRNSADVLLNEHLSI